MKIRRIPVLEKTRVMRVGGKHLPRVLDRAEVLLGARSDLVHVVDQPIRVSAVFAVKALDDVQIPQMVPVEDDVISAPDLRDAIDGKAAGLIKRREQVQHSKRDDQPVDDRAGDEVLRSIRGQPVENAALQPLVGPAHTPFEFDAFTFDREQDARFAFVQRSAEFVFEQLDLLKQAPNLGIHVVSSSTAITRLPAFGPRHLGGSYALAVSPA